MDLHDGDGVNLIGSLLDIPLKDGSCSDVYCGHVLEHIAPEQVKDALAEVRRVLAPSGELMIVGPDLDRARPDDPIREVIIGEHPKSLRAGDIHLWVSTEERMLDFIDLYDWRYVCLDINSVSRKWPVVSRIYWQYAIKCTKVL